MTNSLEILKEIGAQRIHKETHISREYVQAIIHENFDDLSSVQFAGFVSILEREYSLDLFELKAKGKAYFDEEKSKSPEVKKVFVVPKRKKSYAKVYTSLVILVFASFAYYLFIYLASQSFVVEKIDNSTIENAQKSISKTLEIKNVHLKLEDVNSTKVENTELNTTSKEIIENKPPQEKKEEVIIEKTLKLLPKNRIWAGYINIETNQKYQKIFKKEFSFDTSKDWLLLFGAGTVKLEVDGKSKKFSSKQNMRFKYIDGVLTKIQVLEFKSLNKGRKW